MHSGSLEAFFLKMDDLAWKRAEVASLLGWCTLLKCVVIDHSQTNRDLEVISDATIIEDGLKKGGTVESDPSPARGNISGNKSMFPSA
jgi:hypothetical protein